MLKNLPPAQRPLIVALLVVIFGGFGVASLVNIVATNYAKHEVTQRDILPLLSHAALNDAEADLYTALKLGESMATNSRVKEWMTSGVEDEAEILQYLRNAKDELGFDLAFIASAKTQNYYFASADEAQLFRPLSRQFPEDSWFFEFIEKGHQFDVNIDADFMVQHTLMLFVNYAVYDENGETIGIVGCSNNIQRLVSRLTKHQHDFGSEIYIVDEVGRIQIHPVTSKLLMASGRHDQTNIAEFEGFKDISAQLLREKPKFTTFSIRRDGQDKIIAARHLPKLNWFLIVEQEPPASLARLLSFTLLGAFLAGITSLVAVILGYKILVRTIRDSNQYQRSDTETGLLSRSYFIDQFINAYDQIGEAEVYIVKLAYLPSQWAAHKLTIEQTQERTTLLANVFQQELGSSSSCARWQDHSFIATVYCNNDIELQAVLHNLAAAYKALEFPFSFQIATTKLEWGISLDLLMARLDSELNNRLAPSLTKQ